LGNQPVPDPACNAIIELFRKKSIKGQLPTSIRSENPVFRRRGSSFDLKNIREYQPFDDLRKIDWSLFGRSGKLFIKEFFEEENDPLFFLVDTSASITVFDTDYYLRFIASLAYILLRLGFRIHLVYFDSLVRSYYSGLRGAGGISKICRTLGEIEFSGETDIPGIIKAVKTKYQPRTVFFFSDFFDTSYIPGQVFKRFFLFHFYRPFTALMDEYGEVLVHDPGTDQSILLPYNRIVQDQISANQQKFLGRFEDKNLRFRYSRFTGDTDRVPAYWNVLDGLYG